METFSTRQTAAIASSLKTVSWLFRVTDSLGNVYYWSTGTQASSGGETILSGALFAPGVYTDSEWERTHTFKIVNFSGITLRRSKSESGIHAPNDVSFTIVNAGNTLDAANFTGGTVRIGLVVDDGLGQELCGSWRFRIKSASPYAQQIDVTCEDFLQEFLQGSYPNTRLISDIFPVAGGVTTDSMCIPEPYGTCYTPLRSVYAGSDRYYILGDTVNTYTISEVRSPRELGAKITWDSAGFTFTQSTVPDAAATDWRMFQAIISDSDGDLVADAAGIFMSGDRILDVPTKFSRSDTAAITDPAEIIRRVLRNMGLQDYDLDLPSFAAAAVTFAGWSLAWNFAFYYKEDRKTVLSRLLAMCHSSLVIGEKVSLQVLSKTSQATVTDASVLKMQEVGPDTFKYTDAISERTSDSGYVAFQQTEEAQDRFLKILVPAKSATDVIDSETITFPGVQDTQQVQKLGTLYYQRKFLKAADISFTGKGTLLALRPDDVITVNYVDFGGTYNVLIDEITVNPDASVGISAIRFSEVLDDWADLAPGAITIASDTPTTAYSPVIAGPDGTTPTSGNLPNSLPGRLRVGQTTNYILLEPAHPLRISEYSADVERMRLGNLNGFLGYVSDLYGIAIGDAVNFLKYDPTNGLRLSGALAAGTIDIGGADTSSFHVDADGNLWAGAVAFNIATNPFAVSNAGLLRAASGAIGGWTIQSTLLQSAVAGAARIELDQANARISIKDSTNASKTVMGYLNGLAKHDGTGSWGAGDYGFWAAAGDNLKIDGDAVYKSGDWIVENDGSYLIQNAAAQTIVRLGTVAGVKGLYIYDAATPTQALLAKFATDGLYLGTPGETANYLKYTAAGGLVIKGTLNIVSGDVSGLGALAVKNSVDLSTAEVTNKSLANVDGTASTKLAGIAAGADVTSANTAAGIAGQGALATLNSADFATQVGGAQKPANNATVGATWGTNLGSIPATLGAPSGSGLFLSSTYMGFYTASAWKTYIDNAGNLILGDIAGGNAGLSWNQGTGVLSIKGSIVLTGGSGWANLTDAPAGLADINATEGSKLSGIAAGADVTLAAVNGLLTITGGGIVLNAAGVIRGGQSAYATGTGFFLGYEGAAYKFSIGNATKFMKWDGAALTVGGDIISTENIKTDAITVKGSSKTVAYSYATPFNVWKDIGPSVTLTFIAGTSVLVFAKGWCYYNSGALFGSAVRVLRGTSDLVDQTWFMFNDVGAKCPFSLVSLDAPGPGTLTYKLQANSGYGVEFNDLTLSVIELLR